MELSLFPDIPATPKTQPATPRGGSQNPIVFHDYASYVAKFQKNNAKTTDDTYTPPDVYEAVISYLRSMGFLQSHHIILRPFYPGGDYLHADYPPDGIVIDNPPFSIFSKIVRHYTDRHIPFFLFGPGMTILSCAICCTAVIANTSIRFDNGATVRINFASNLFPGSPVAVTAPALYRAISACPSQQTGKKTLPRYAYPDEVISVSRLQQIATHVEFSIPRSEAQRIRDLDFHPKGRGALFGDHLLVSSRVAEQARTAAEQARTIHIPLSPREQAIVHRLSQKPKGK